MLHLAQITIYPLKSFDSIPVTEARVLPSGSLENDRRFALFDENGRVVNGKRTPLVHTLRTRFADDFSTIEVRHNEEPQGEVFSLSEDRERLNERFSRHFGYPVRLEENREHGFPDSHDPFGPTVVATESLATIAQWFNLSEEETRVRFRPSLVVAGGQPFWEDRLVPAPGGTVTFRIGEVLFFGLKVSRRCPVPTREPLTGEAIDDFVKRFMQLRRETFPEWAVPEAFDHFYRLAANTQLYAPSEGGTIRLGDPVEIVADS